MERREFIKGGGAIAGLAGAGLFANPGEILARGSSSASVQRPTRATQFAGNSVRVPMPLMAESADLAPYTGAWTDTQLLHLLRRATFGITFNQLTEARALGSMSAVVNKLTDTSAPPPTPPGSYINEYLGSRSDTQVQAQSHQRLELMRSQEVVNWWFDLMVHEDLSIREKMTLLWSNHFVTGTSVVQRAGYTYQYLATLRQYSLGNFRNFVEAIAIDPAMLVYLNGNQNFTKNINENFARELMELFTLGLVDPKTGQPNYTETDVQNSAKALSGWVPNTVPNASAPYFTGSLVPNRHDTSTNTYLGKPCSTLQNVLDAIFALGNGYNVAWFVSQKIYMNFVYYDSSSAESQGVIDAMATLLIQSNWELKPVMQALLSSAHFYDANVIGSQLKSPIEFFTTFFRDFGMTYPAYSNADPPSNGVDGKGVTTYTDSNPSLSYLTTLYAGGLLGQELLNPPNVKGWPGGENWVSTGTFQDREGASFALLSNAFDGSKRVKGVKYTFDAKGWALSYPNALQIKDSDLANDFEAVLLALKLGPIESGELFGAFDPNQQDFYIDDAPVRAFAQVLAQLPEFQLI